MTQPINSFKIKAFKEEFPFLDGMPRILFKKLKSSDAWDFCDNITVKRVTRELLEIVPRTYPIYQDYCCSELYYLFNKKNELIEEIKPEYDNGLLGELDTQLEYYGEKIIECIGRLLLNNKIVIDDIKYIVKYHSGYVNPDRDDAEYFFKLTIFKESKDENIGDIITEKLNTAKREVKAEINF